MALVQALLAFTKLKSTARGHTLTRTAREAVKPLWTETIDGAPNDNLFHAIALFRFGLDHKVPRKHVAALQKGRWYGDDRATIKPGNNIAALRAVAKKYGNDLRAIRGSRTVYSIEDSRWGDRSIGQVRGLHPEARNRLQQAQSVFNRRFGINLLAHRIQPLHDGEALPPRLLVEARVLFLHPSDIEFRGSGYGTDT